MPALPVATAAMMSCCAGSSTHHNASSGIFRGASPKDFFGRKCAPWRTWYSACNGLREPGRCPAPTLSIVKWPKFRHVDDVDCVLADPVEARQVKCVRRLI
jgi:hypothetical protein